MTRDEDGRPIPQDYDGEPLWSALPKYWIGVPVYEWKNRTWWGKLKFPFWVVMSALCWAVFLPLLLVALTLKAGSETERKIAERMPSTHKDD